MAKSNFHYTAELATVKSKEYVLWTGKKKPKREIKSVFTTHLICSLSIALKGEGAKANLRVLGSFFTREFIFITLCIIKSWH